MKVTRTERKMGYFKRCVLCGESAVEPSTVRDYEYRTPMGAVVIEGDCRLETCGSCKEVFVPGELIERWNRLILDSLSKQQGALSPQELQFAFSVLPYSQNELAKAVGKERSTLTRYKTGDNPIDPLFDDTLKRIMIEHLAGNEETLDRLRARTQFVAADQRIRRLKMG